MRKKELVILMATYNGEKYLKEQIDSIVAQTYKDWQLIIRDDNSSDNTINIINNYIVNFPNKIRLVKNSTEKHGSKNNFLSLKKLAIKENYEYAMFCDQDDVWEENKIKLTLDEMKKIERNSEIPALVHTDLKVVDEKLNTIFPSFKIYSKLNPINDYFSHLLVENTVTGCTMLVNRALLIKSESIKKIDDIIMHDWLFALLAAIYGNISYINAPTILYRQHGNNVVGAKKNNFVEMSKKIFTFNKNKDSLKKTIKQAEVILDSFNDLPKNIENILKGYSRISKENKYRRIKFLISNKILKTNTIKKVGEFIFI